MTQNAVIFNKKIIISCITVIAALLLCAFCACIGGRGTGQESTAAPALLTPSVEPTAEMTIKPSAAATNDPEEDIVAEMMTEMTLEEKVGSFSLFVRNRWMKASHRIRRTARHSTATRTVRRAWRIFSQRILPGG